MQIKIILTDTLIITMQSDIVKDLKHILTVKRLS